MKSRLSAIWGLLFLAGCAASPGGPVPVRVSVASQKGGDGKGDGRVPGRTEGVASNDRDGAVADAAAPSSTSLPLTLEVATPSKLYGFWIALHGACEDAPDMNDCPGVLVVRVKATQEEVQTIALNQVLLSRDEPAPPSCEIAIDDFNFDGREDFAVAVNRSGPHIGVTYQVYLFSRRQRRFVFSPKLSELTQVNEGLFQVDRKRKRLRTWHWGTRVDTHEEYRVVDDVPTPVWRETESRTQDEKGEDTTTTASEHRVNGRWRLDARVHSPTR